MPKNTIILTWGTTGSSALCQLLRNCGYWCGDETLKKPDYDTHENARLVSLNQKILDSAGYRGGYEHQFDAAGINTVSVHTRNTSLSSDLHGFVQTCGARSPWLWKDPRLALTLRHWLPLIDVKTTKFIILSREPLQMWIASQLRRHIQGYFKCKRALVDYEAHATGEVERIGAEFITMTFEDLKRRPESMSRKVLEFLAFPPRDIREHLAHHVPNYGAIHGTFDLAHAALIYVKNLSFHSSVK